MNVVSPEPFGLVTTQTWVSQYVVHDQDVTLVESHQLAATVGILPYDASRESVIPDVDRSSGIQVMARGFVACVFDLAFKRLKEPTFIGWPSGFQHTHIEHVNLPAAHGAPETYRTVSGYVIRDAIRSRCWRGDPQS